ncbi:MAG: DUF4159 domain-containing protein [candidate division KSB1 bacterium]|nr:DUF4159 domain-containing protein [candidate division KSB1 bacterium]MDZ7346385.1 DUF4159 domain-containing protein [candidate division KSB1 bacterium]
MTIWLLFILLSQLSAQEATEGRFVIARLKYSGGGDWYNDPSIIPNLLQFLRENTTVPAAKDEIRISLMDEELFSVPFLFMTGHGRVAFSDQEVERLRKYLTSGGFLYADDDYGMDDSFRREMARVFPDKEMVELPFSHEIYHCHFQFPTGLPKIHEHDSKPPKGYAYFHEGRMVVFYTYESNISDGWADADVHGDPFEVREQALQMGTNIVIYALTQ